MRTDDEDEDEEEEAPKTKKVKETVWDWDLLNDNKALWLRSPSDVGDDEYANFYKALAKVLTLHSAPSLHLGNYHVCIAITMCPSIISVRRGLNDVLCTCPTLSLSDGAHSALALVPCPCLVLLA